MPKRRRDVSSLIQELREACRRPLFVEINLYKRLSSAIVSADISKRHLAAQNSEVASQSSSNRDRSPRRERKAECETEKRSWEEILIEAADLLPCMTEQEHGQVLHMASVLLLGYFLPFSTGNEFFLLQNMPHNPKEASGQQTADYVLKMPLIDRLEKSVHQYNVNDFPDMDTLTDVNVDLAFESFLTNGIAPLFAGRPAHREEVDLLHLFAMAIHPTVSIEASLVQTVRRLSDDDPNLINRPAWRKARQLEHTHAASLFQINYGHRVRLVQLLVDSLVLPAIVEDSVEPISSLRFGVLPHLRASLRCFAQATKSPRDAHLANVCFAKIAVQSAKDGILHDDWDFLLERMVEDSSDYGCSECHIRTDSTSPAFLTVGAAQKSTLFCRHSARGNLLAYFVINACQSRKRLQQDPEASHMLERASSSLADAIEWQLDSWTKHPEGERSGLPTRHAPCLLASLLYASQSLFLFLPPSSAYDETRETLIESALQLLHHSHEGIARSSSQLLLHAFSIDSKSKTTCVAFAPALLQSATKLMKAKGFTRMQMLKPVIAVVVDKCPPLGASLMKMLVGFDPDDDKDNATTESFCRWIAAVASNCPSVVPGATVRLTKMLETDSLSLTCRSQLTAGLLSGRLARLFNGNDTEVNEAVLRFTSLSVIDHWTRYKMACHAVTTGNYFIAASQYRLLLDVPMLGEKFHLWLSVLDRCASGEAALLEKGALGIPATTQHLRAAASFLQLLQVVEKGRLSFQSCFVLLRLDFLDLVTVVRQLARDMRLTGVGPSRSTRSHYHLRNVVRNLIALSARIKRLYRSHGMQFSYAQSGNALRIFQELALFVAGATRAVFSDALLSAPAQLSMTSFSTGPYRHPLAALMRRLDDGVVKPLDAGVDPLIRAAAMLEVLDGVLMVPMPIPRDFLTPRAAVGATLHLSVDPSQAFEPDDELCRVEAFPLMCFSFNVSGSIDVKQSTVPICTAVVWYRLLYVGPLLGDDDVGGDDANQDGNYDSPSPDEGRETIVKRLPVLSTPATSTINSAGQFFVTVECPPLLDEGYFSVEVKLGCQDTLGREWEIPVKQSLRRLSIRRNR